MPSLEDMRRVLPTLDKNRFRVLVNAVLKMQPDEVPGTAQRLKMGIYEWLSHLGVVSETGIRLILTGMDSDLYKYAKRLDGGVGIPIFTLTLAECRYAVWPGRTSWLDVMDECEVTELPGRPVTHITCDLGALHLQMEARLKRLRGGADDKPQHHAGAAETQTAAVPCRPQDAAGS